MNLSSFQIGCVFDPFLTQCQARKPRRCNSLKFCQSTHLTGEILWMLAHLRKRSMQIWGWVKTLKLDADEIESNGIESWEMHLLCSYPFHHLAHPVTFLGFMKKTTIIILSKYLSFTLGKMCCILSNWLVILPWYFHHYPFSSGL